MIINIPYNKKELEVIENENVYQNDTQKDIEYVGSSKSGHWEIVD